MNRKFITQLVIVLIAIFSFASCKKDKQDVTQQDLAASAQGTYDVYYLKDQSGTYNLPNNGVSAFIDVRRQEKDVVEMTFSVGNGTQNEDQEFGTIQLKNENSTTVMYSGSDRLGTISGNELEINVSDGTEEYIIKARK